MPWLVVEGMAGNVEVINLQHVTSIGAAGKKDGRIEVELCQVDGTLYFDLKDRKQLEILINILEAEHGWFYIKDGEVKLWKGVFEELKPKDGEADASSH